MLQLLADGQVQPVPLRGDGQLLGVGRDAEALEQFPARREHLHLAPLEQDEDLAAVSGRRHIEGRFRQAHGLGALDLHGGRYRQRRQHQ